MAQPLEISPGDIGQRRIVIERLLASSEDEALDKLIDFAVSFGSKDQKHDAIVISNEYFEYRRAEKRGTLPLDEFGKVKKPIVYRSLDLMEEIVLKYQRLGPV